MNMMTDVVDGGAAILRQVRRLTEMMAELADGQLDLMRRLRRIEMALVGDVGAELVAGARGGGAVAAPQASTPPGVRSAEDLARLVRASTAKQLATLMLVMENLLNDEVAKVLGVGPSTVKGHVAAMLERARCVSRADLVEDVRRVWGQVGVAELAKHGLDAEWGRRVVQAMRDGDEEAVKAAVKKLNAMPPKRGRPRKA